MGKPRASDEMTKYGTTNSSIGMIFSAHLYRIKNNTFVADTLIMKAGKFITEFNQIYY